MIVWRKEMIETMKIRFCKLYSRVSSPLDDLNEALEGVEPDAIELCKAVLQRVYDNLT